VAAREIGGAEMQSAVPR